MSEISIGDVTARLKMDSSQFDKAISDAQAKLKSLTDAVGQQREHVQRATDMWRTMFQIAGGLGIVTSVSAATNAIKDFAISTIETGARMQQLQTSLNVVSGGLTAGASNFQFVTDTANRYGFSLQTLTQSYVQLTAATRGTSLAGQQTREVFEAITAAARTYGSSQQSVERALVALQQMVSKGTVSMEELRQQLGDALPGAFQTAARAMGVTTEALNDMLRRGEVLTTDFLPRFARQLREEMGQGAERAAETAQVAFARLENEWMMLKNRIAQAGPLRLVVNVVGGLTDILRAGREEAEATQARLERLTREPVEVRPGRRRPGIIDAATPEELERLRKFAAQANDVADASARELIARITRRSIEAQAVAARTAGLAGEDPLRAQAAAAAAAEEAQKKLGEALKGLRQDLMNVGEAGNRLPNVFGTMTGNADLKVRALDGQIKVLEKGLKDLDEQTRSRRGGPTDDLQMQMRAMDTQLGALRAQREAIIKAEQEAESARTKAASEAEAARKRAAADYERDLERAKVVQATIATALERARAFGRAPEEDTAERAGTAVRLQGAQLRAQLEAQLLAFQQSQVLVAQQPGLGKELQDAIAGIATETERLAQAAVDAKIEENVLVPLRKLAAQYMTTKEIRDTDTASTLAGAAANTKYAEEATKLAQAVSDSATVLAQLPRLQADATRSFERWQFLQDMQSATQGLQRQIGPEEDRMAVKMRQEAERRGIALGEEGEQWLKNIAAMQQAHQIYRLGETAITSTANNIRAALVGVADGTQNVSDAFKQMALNIVTSLRDIALNETFRMLITFGLRTLAGALMPSTPTLTGGDFPGAQHGAVVNRPTPMLIGENASLNPEVVLNRPQLESLFRATPSAGGQAAGGSGITIINVSSQEEANRQAFRERSMGREVIINQILSNISQGESSSIVRALRTVQR